MRLVEFICMLTGLLIITTSIVHQWLGLGTIGAVWLGITSHWFGMETGSKIVKEVWGIRE